MGLSRQSGTRPQRACRRSRGRCRRRACSRNNDTPCERGHSKTRSEALKEFEELSKIAYCTRQFGKSHAGSAEKVQPMNIMARLRKLGHERCGPLFRSIDIDRRQASLSVIAIPEMRPVMPKRPLDAQPSGRSPGLRHGPRQPNLGRRGRRSSGAAPWRQSSTGRHRSSVARPSFVACWTPGAGRRLATGRSCCYPAMPA